MNGSLYCSSLKCNSILTILDIIACLLVDIYSTNIRTHEYRLPFCRSDIAINSDTFKWEKLAVNYKPEN